METVNDKIINVYKYKDDGKKLSSSDNKYTVDYAIYKGWPTKAIDCWLNHGQLVCSGSKIYSITSLFGDIFASDFKGNLITSRTMEKINLWREKLSLFQKRDDQ